MSLPLAFKQTLWFNLFGECYFGKCSMCYNIIDCFNFDVIEKTNKIVCMECMS
jgi:hypothetical protein